MTDSRPTPQPAATDDAIALTRLAVEAIVDKKGLDPVAMDVAELLQITEVFLVASGTSRRQVQTLADEVKERLRDDAELRPLRVEGIDEGEWILLDFIENQFLRTRLFFRGAGIVGIHEDIGIEKAPIVHAAALWSKCVAPYLD